ncbi:Protein YceI [Streptomyces alboniger]
MERAATRRQAPPETGTYAIDAEASVVRFRTRSVFGLFPVRGTFALAGGSVTVAAPAEVSTVDATIRADSFASGLRRRDAHVRSADYLDAAGHPEILFRSTGLRRAGDGAVLAGLTVRGVTRPVDVGVREVAAEGGDAARHGHRRPPRVRGDQGQAACGARAETEGGDSGDAAARAATARCCRGIRMSGSSGQGAASGGGARGSGKVVHVVNWLLRLGMRVRTGPFGTRVTSGARRWCPAAGSGGGPAGRTEAPAGSGVVRGTPPSEVRPRRVSGRVVRGQAW